MRPSKALAVRVPVASPCSTAHRGRRSLTRRSATRKPSASRASAGRRGVSFCKPQFERGHSSMRFVDGGFFAFAGRPEEDFPGSGALGDGDLTIRLGNRANHGCGSGLDRDEGHPESPHSFVKRRTGTLGFQAVLRRSRICQGRRQDLRREHGGARTAERQLRRRPRVLCLLCCRRTSWAASVGLDSWVAFGGITSLRRAS